MSVVVPTAVSTAGVLPGRLREDGYDLPPGLPWERWLEIGDTLQQMQRSINWWVGDWLRYGEANFGDVAYQAVKEVTGRGDESLQQSTWVAAKFPPGTRVPELSWSHHRAVLLEDLPMEDARSLLQEAAVDGLPVRELVERAKRRKDEIAVTKLEARSEPAPAAWMPTEADLTTDARRALMDASGKSAAPEGFIDGALWAWRWAGDEALFKPDRWRD